jgi:hypothetical protein
MLGVVSTPPQYQLISTMSPIGVDMLAIRTQDCISFDSLLGYTGVSTHQLVYCFFVRLLDSSGRSILLGHFSCNESQHYKGVQKLPTLGNRGSSHVVNTSETLSKVGQSEEKGYILTKKMKNSMVRLRNATDEPKSIMHTTHSGGCGQLHKSFRNGRMWIGMRDISCSRCLPNCTSV